VSDPAGPSSPAAGAESERVFGLLLFEAEECLARGNVGKAAVHASRAVKERPESLTARSLLDRARRELTRGRRRERLEERVVEARQRLAGGEDQAAEKIVATVLKLLPDHAAALQLFSVLKDRRLMSGTAEAEAELELDAMARSRARRAAESARAALKAGWSFRALMTVRRALSVTPDDAELLALYAESLRLVDRTAGQRAVRRAAHVRILEARERVASGKPEEAARILRSVLKEDPQNREALEALGNLERAGPGLHMAGREPGPRLAGRRDSRAGLPDPAALTGKFSHRPVVAGGAQPAMAASRMTAPGGRPFATMVIGGGAVLLIVGVSLAFLRDAPAAGVEPRQVETPSSRGNAVAARAVEETDRAFAGQDPELRRAVEDVLARYGRALETIDADLLAEARPDMGARALRDLIAEREGATNVASDLRVLDVARRGNQASVKVRRTEVVVAGRSVDRPSVEETLRFQREGGAWVLRPSR
jgi:tetratricopeptide (TPR) repeat protein